MRTLLITSCLFFYSLGSLFAQNLVPNPSFEEYLICPINVVGFNNQAPPYESFIQNWYSMNGTPDYFHECSGDESFNYPSDNGWGSQTPKEGEAYTAFVTIDQAGDDREYLAVQLTEPLIIGQSYNISYFISDADGGALEDFECSSNNIGARFFLNPSFYWNSFDDHQSLLPDNFSHINENQIVDDSLGWTEISGVFIADASYTHLVFGNFFTEANTLVSTPDLNSCIAIYYLDEVCVSQIGNSCLIPNSIDELSNQDLSVYPNPCSSEIFFDISNKGVDATIRILNLQGEIVYFKQLRLHSGQRLNISNLEKGVYQMTISTLRDQLYQQLLIKN